MNILNVYEEYTHVYTYKHERVQKATLHLGRNDLKRKLQSETKESLLLLDESCFERYHMTVRITQTDVFTWSQYKALVTKKLQEIQEELGVKSEQIVYSIKNMRINKQPVSYIIGESGTIVFDICCFVLKTERSDLIQLQHLRRYPRRYFLLSHPLLAKKKNISLLTTEKQRSTLICLEHGWYKKIHTLNGGEDLFWQAVEQAGLDTRSHDINDFDEHSIGYKLSHQARTDFNELLLGRLESHLETGEDLMFVSRLLDQKELVTQLSEGYMEKQQGRLLPYRAAEYLTSYGRSWTLDEVPVLMVLKKMGEK